MCGIAGILGAEIEQLVLQRMLRTMAHRGPDGQGVYSDGDMHLLHARLAIIDPEGGRQPMELWFRKERYVIVYNGELYNTEEIRQELNSLGHRFLGHSDTEVAIHAYAQWGPECVDRFNGIFALAVWEQNSRRLFLARDRMGVKPLFYSLFPGGMVFASEMKTLFASNLVRPRLDRDGAAQLLLLGPGRLPGSGVFHGVQELEPGCRGYFDRGRFIWERYWALRDREHCEDMAQTVEQVRFLVTDAIERQMVSDVPIGTFLSGGLDSSIISAICAGRVGDGLDTFSVDYRDNDRFFRSNKFQPEADGDYIRIMEETIHSRHHRTVIGAEELVNALEDATIARDLPGMADVDFSLLVFCKEIRSHVKVALSGECADEIFGGYPWYYDPEIRAREGFPWAQNTALRASLLTEDARQGISPGDFVMDAYRAACRESDILPGTDPKERRMKEMVNLNFRYFMQTLLDRKDRMSMYHGLEVRVPFCDYRVAEYLYGVPWELKYYEGREKGLLRLAMEGILPERVLYRKKSPYPKTFDPEYERMVSKQLKDVMEMDSPLFHLVNRDKIWGLLTSEESNPWYGQLMRRPQVIAYFLQMDFWLKKYRVELMF